MFRINTGNLVTFDANIIFKDPLFNGATAMVVQDSAEELGYVLAITDMVFQEIVNNRKNNIDSAIKAVKTDIRKINSLGFHFPGITPSSDDIEEANQVYLDRLSEIFSNKSTLKNPEISHEQIAERAMLSTRPFQSKDRGYRDTLIWLSLLQHLERSDDSIIFITDDDTFYDVKEKKNIHQHLIDDLVNSGVELDRLIMYRGLDAFVKEHVTPRLKLRQEIASGLKDGSVFLPDAVTEAVSINLQDYLWSQEWEPWRLGYETAFDAEADVLENVVLNTVEDVRILNDGNLFIPSIWTASINVIFHGSGYQTDYKELPVFARINMILDPNSLQIVTLDIVTADIFAPPYYDELEFGPEE